MLQQVVLHADDPMTLDIDGVDPDEIIIIQSISGLDPADVTLFTGDFSRDGGYYQGRRSGTRNVVFNLKLNPNYADDIEVSDIREMLYAMFFEPSEDGDQLQVTLKDDRKPDRYFFGATEKMPSDIFSRDTKAQVSMLCVDPFLKSVDAYNFVDAVGWTSLGVEYEGSAKTGLIMEFKVKTATPVMNLEIGLTKMTLTKAFALNDEIEINTIPGERYIRHNGVDIMAALTSGPDWVRLRKGTNDLKVYGGVVGDGKVALMEYRYREAWWGI